MVSDKVEYCPLHFLILSKMLKECKTGCVVGESLINHLIYADDWVILSPYSAGLQQLLRVCSRYGVHYDIEFNSKKSVIMINSWFRAYCTPLYTAHLWCSYSKGQIKKIQVAFNDAFRILLKLPKWTSASQMFVSRNVPTFHAVLRNFMYKFKYRLRVIDNLVIKALADPVLSDTRYLSCNGTSVCMFFNPEWIFGCNGWTGVLVFYCIVFYILLLYLCLLFYGPMSLE